VRDLAPGVAAVTSSQAIHLGSAQEGHHAYSAHYPRPGAPGAQRGRLARSWVSSGARGRRDVTGSCYRVPCGLPELHGVPRVS
jgi:hypothetical protein